MHSAKKLLSGLPEAGTLDETKGGEIRRLLLRRTSYLVFYRIHEKPAGRDDPAGATQPRLPPGPICIGYALTGTGTRFLTDDGREAIRSLFERSFG